MRVLILVAGLCLAAAACSKSDADRIGRDTKAAGQDIGAEARKVGQDPAIRDAGANLKDAGHDAAVALRHDAAVADVKVKDAARTTDAQLHKTDREARKSAQGEGDRPSGQ